MRHAPDPIQSFRPLSTFLVPGRTSAEIVAATPDGTTLVYTDALGGRLGVVDLSNPEQPVQTAAVEVNGQPTSVAITLDGRFAITTVKRTLFAEDDVVDPSTPGLPGELQMFDLQHIAASPVVFPIAAGPNGELGYLLAAIQRPFAGEIPADGATHTASAGMICCSSSGTSSRIR